MDSTQQQSCIDYFYERTIQDSNIVNIDFLMDLLSEEQKVELRDTPYRDINFQKLAQSVQSTSEWATKPSKGGKQAIVKYDMKSGNVLSVGTANSKGNQNLLLIKNVKSQFANHAYAFGDETEKEMLNQSLNSFTSECEYDVKKQIGKVGISFNICNETEDLQQNEGMLGMKLLTLMHEMIVLQVAFASDPINKNRCGKGFIKTAYDNKSKQDIQKLNAQLQLIPLGAYDQPLHIIKVANADSVFSGSLDVQPVEYSEKTVKDIMNMLRLKNLDIVVAIGSACTKKEGKVINVYPSIKIVQIVMKDSNNDNSNTRSHGLNLSTFNIK